MKQSHVRIIALVVVAALVLATAATLLSLVL